MAIPNFEFNPTTGLRDKVTFPTTPANEDEARNQVQSISDQIRDYINNTLIPGIDADYASKTQEPWIAPTLLNGWFVNAGFAVGYYKSETSLVEIKGEVKGGSSGSTIFILPIGFRPKETKRFLCVRNNDLSPNFTLYVDSNGEVRIYGSFTSSDIFTINCIFRAEQ